MAMESVMKGKIEKCNKDGEYYLTKKGEKLYELINAESDADTDEDCEGERASFCLDIDSDDLEKKCDYDHYDNCINIHTNDTLTLSEYYEYSECGKYIYCSINHVISKKTGRDRFNVHCSSCDHYLKGIAKYKEKSNKLDELNNELVRKCTELENKCVELEKQLNATKNN